MSIQNRALLADLNLGKFTNKIQDKEAQQKIVDTYQCDKKAISSKKTILSQALKPLQSIISGCYNYHIKSTLPWEDRSWRLLPTIKFFDYTEEIRKFKDELTLALMELEKTYQEDIKNDEAYLKGLQKMSDYPTFESLSKQYRIELNFAPLPSSSDFRIECEADQLEQLKKNYEDREKSLLHNLAKDLYIRLSEPLKHLVETLVDPSIKIYHKSLLTNIENVIKLVASYNIIHDEKITEIIDEINKSILKYEIKTIKTDNQSKMDIISNTNQVLLQINENLNNY